MKEYATTKTQAKATLIQQAWRASLVLLHWAVPSWQAKLVVG